MTFVGEERRNAAKHVGKVSGYINNGDNQRKYNVMKISKKLEPLHTFVKNTQLKIQTSSSTLEVF